MNHLPYLCFRRDLLSMELELMQLITHGFIGVLFGQESIILESRWSSRRR